MCNGKRGKVSVATPMVETRKAASRDAGRAMPGNSVSAMPGDSVAPERDVSGSDDALVVEDLLVEDVSIDGMCGVY
jgi:mycofactocin precursor